MPLYTIHHYQPALDQRSQVKSHCHIHTVGSEITDEFSLSIWCTIHRLLPSTHPFSFTHSLQIHLQTSLITASKCISRLSRLWAVSLHNHGFQVHLQTRSIAASKWISKLAQLWPTSACRNPLRYNPELYLQGQLITVSNYISKYAQLPHPSASLNSLCHSLGVYPWVHSILIFRPTSICSQVLFAGSPDIPCVNW